MKYLFVRVDYKLKAMLVCKVTIALFFKRRSHHIRIDRISLVCDGFKWKAAFLQYFDVLKEWDFTLEYHFRD